MENIIGYLTFVVSTLFTYFMGIISKKHKWNETLPIPIQNMLVGLIVFVLTYVFCLAMKINMKTEDMIEQIIFAMGGARNCYIGI